MFCRLQYCRPRILKDTPAEQLGRGDADALVGEVVLQPPHRPPDLSVLREGAGVCVRAWARAWVRAYVHVYVEGGWGGPVCVRISTAKFHIYKTM